MNISLLSLCKHWDYDMRGNMMESISQDIKNGMTLIEALEILVDVYFEQWINEDDENKDMYINYQARFRNVLEDIKNENTKEK